MRILPTLMMAILLIMAIEVAVWYPEPFSDKNAFLKGFMNQELLSLLGVIVSITLGTTAMLNLELNKVTEGTGEGFPEARTAIKRSAIGLIIGFCLALIIVVVKPLAAGSINAQAGFNLAGLAIIVFSLAVLVDIQLAAFGIPPIKRG